MKFKEKLQLLRTNMKLSQEELANRLNISRQSITKWENGQSFPDIQNLIQISEIFKVSMPFRGPEFYQKGDYMYQCQMQGDFEYFSGEERIYCRQEKVYVCMFHGGIIL